MPLDELEEDRRAVSRRAGEDLQQVAVLVTVDQDSAALQFFYRNPDVADPLAQFEAVLAWAAAVGYASIRASVWEWNSASRRVLEKLGFVDSGGDGGPPSEHGRNILTVRPLSASVAEQRPH